MKVLKLEGGDYSAYWERYYTVPDDLTYDQLADKIAELAEANEDEYLNGENLITDAVLDCGGILIEPDMAVDCGGIRRKKDLPLWLNDLRGIPRPVKIYVKPSTFADYGLPYLTKDLRQLGKKTRAALIADGILTTPQILERGQESLLQCRSLTQDMIDEVVSFANGARLALHEKKNR